MMLQGMTTNNPEPTQYPAVKKPSPSTIDNKVNANTSNRKPR